MLYLIEILHQTTTSYANWQKQFELYLIEILHQTTTSRLASIRLYCCILSKFYIKPQLGHNYPQFCSCCILSKFYIKPQQQTLKDFHQFSCILSKFYIKPQLFYLPVYRYIRCILSKFYIKPQLRLERELACCVVSYRNSTSNHNSRAASSISAGVVSYRNSTSNHNSLTTRYDSRGVVSYRNSTSNHNVFAVSANFTLLYLIEILHQTTTRGWLTLWIGRCILSKFYIKPQRPDKQ